MISPDGEEGFPGEVHLQVQFSLVDNQFLIHYLATTTKPTPINLTNHTHFNLLGYNRPINDHLMELNSSYYLPTDETVVPTGEIVSVDHTPFDFKKMTRIDKGDGWFEGTRGYDHCFIMNSPTSKDELNLITKLYCEQSGIHLEVRGTQPGVQIYTSNFFDGSIKAKKSQIKEGESTSDFYEKQAGVAIETQHYPDTPNHPDFPSIFIYPEQEYNHSTAWKFSVQ